MKFAGQIRIPEVDHPGIPAAVVVEDTHVEVVVGGESLGKWSLFDVRARRLVSSAFQLDLAGEELTFIADEPVDFAYRGVERMAEVWAQFKTMRGPQRMLAVRKSRSGARPSRIPEMRSAMELNLAAPKEPPSMEPEPVVESVPTRPPPNRPPPNRPPVESVPSEPVAPPGPGVTEQPGEPSDPRSPVLTGIDAERARLVALREEAVARDLARSEEIRAEMTDLENQQAEIDRVESERAVAFQAEMERLRGEMRELKSIQAQLSDTHGEDSDKVKLIEAEVSRVESARQFLQQTEDEHLSSLRLAAEQLAARKEDLDRQEAERWQAHRREIDRLTSEAEELERRSTASAMFLEEAPVEEQVPAEEMVPAEAEAPIEDETPEPEVGESSMLREVLGTSTSDDGSKEVLVDLGYDKSEAVQPEPGPAPVKEKAGFMGAVKSAFSRDSKEHDHVFVEAPGSMGLTRSICQECGFVSISVAD